jgi:UDP-N-acetylglucosamine 2-epimerase
MDEAAAALDFLKPRVIVTYAEAGGWGRALVLEARRRGIPTVGLQHGFISRHWLNYLHEPDEMVAAPGQPDDSGFPVPTRTLLFDEFARDHLERFGRFPASSLRVVGNPRLDAIVAANRAIGPDEVQRVRAAAGATPGQHLVLLAIKYRPALNETLRALVAAVQMMPDVLLVVRPHPADAPATYGPLLDRIPNARVVDRALDPVALIRASRLIVTINSTVAIEAIPLGVPALAMRLPNYLSPFVEAGAMAGTTATSEIAPTLARLVNDETARAALLTNARQFAERYRIIPDGRTADRTVEIVEQLIRCRPEGLTS